MNQTDLADALGLTPQQVQKYEHGTNRVSASRLWVVAEILGVPISFFFSDLTSGTPEENALGERLQQPETIELVRLYYAIPEQRVREQSLEMVKAVAGRKPTAEPPVAIGACTERWPQPPSTPMTAGHNTCIMSKRSSRRVSGWWTITCAPRSSGIG
jgi:transcriptional regulator with XRE-family HTH domain